jgi:transcriptional regulator with XRE-family HTH domain
MKASPALAALPLPVRRALAKLGEDLSAARRRRRMTMAVMAERAFVSRQTVARVERGDPGVSIGIYATVIFALGMTDRLAALVEPSADRLGLMLEDEHLPKRVRSVRQARS